MGLVGFGKIARDQHLPAIERSDRAHLVAVASRNARADGVANYPNLEAMLAGGDNLDAIILCQPPQARYLAARMALLSGKHVFLEKPPGATLSEVEALIALAKSQRVTLYASWHARYGAAVAPAKLWLATRAAKSIAITWNEDVRHWHPGQDWIWEPGGFGVFDPGINALSILTHIISEPVRLVSAALETPSNRQAPIAANLSLETASGIPIWVQLDWRQTGQQTRDIDVNTDAGLLRLSHGGNQLSIDGIGQIVPPEAEYAAMYRHFTELIGEAQSDVDISPLRIVADALLRGRQHQTDPFMD